MAKRIDLNELALETIEYVVGDKVITVPADPLLPIQKKLQKLHVNIGIYSKKIESKINNMTEKDIEEVDSINEKLYDLLIDAVALILGQDEKSNVDREFIENKLSPKQLNLVYSSYSGQIRDIEEAKNSKSPRSKQTKKTNS